MERIIHNRTADAIAKLRDQNPHEAAAILYRLAAEVKQHAKQLDLKSENRHAPLTDEQVAERLEEYQNKYVLPHAAKRARSELITSAARERIRVAMEAKGIEPWSFPSEDEVPH